MRVDGSSRVGAGGAAGLGVPAYGGAARRRALLFTMDSLEDFSRAAAKGGPAGELAVRHCLTDALAHSGIDVEAAGSDAAFFAAAERLDDFDLVFVDPWTAFGPGWVPRPFLTSEQAMRRTFVLDFFGSEEKDHGPGHGWMLPASHILTPFGAPGNGYLGLCKEEPAPEALLAAADKRRQGVIWGKKPEYLAGHAALLLELLERCECDLVSVASMDGGRAAQRLPQHPRLRYVGHQTPQQWMVLLAQSKFLLGLGDPLLGPSAVDAVSVGTAFINPQLSGRAARRHYASQHPWVAAHVGEPAVCTVDLSNVDSVAGCVEQALEAELPARVPGALTVEAHRRRVRRLFADFLPPDAPPVETLDDSQLTPSGMYAP